MIDQHINNPKNLLNKHLFVILEKEKDIEDVDLGKKEMINSTLLK